MNNSDLDNFKTIHLKVNKSKVTCKICSLIWLRRNPKILLCKHTFCEECINELVLTSDIKPEKIVCPVCSCATPWSSKEVNGLMTNDTLENLYILELESSSDDQFVHVPIHTDIMSIKPENISNELCLEHSKKINLLCVSCNVKPICTSCTINHPLHLIFDPDDFENIRKDLFQEKSNLLIGLQRALIDQKTIFLEKLNQNEIEARHLLQSEQFRLQNDIKNAFTRRVEILDKVDILIKKLNEELRNFNYLDIKSGIENNIKEFMKESVKPPCHFDSRITVSLGKIYLSFNLSDLKPFASIKMKSDQIEGLCINDGMLYATSWVCKDPPKSAILRFRLSDFKQLTPFFQAEKFLATGLCFIGDIFYCADWLNDQVVIIKNETESNLFHKFISVLKPFGLSNCSENLLIAAGDGVHMINMYGKLFWVNNSPHPHSWYRPCGIASDGNFVYVTDLHSNLIHKLDIINGERISTASVLSTITKNGHPAGIIVLNNSRVIIANTQNQQLDLIDENCTIIDKLSIDIKPIWMKYDTVSQTLFISTYLNNLEKAITIFQHA